MLCTYENQFLEEAELRQIQLERLQSTLQRIQRNVAFYQRRFKEINFDPDEFSSLKDLEKLPFTTEEDLSRAYPYDMFAINLRHIVRIHSTTGKDKDPIVIGFTENDLKVIASLVLRTYQNFNLSSEDVFQITLNYGLGTAAFSFHEGAHLLKASTIPASAGRTEKQIKMMLDFGTTCLIATPSYLKILKNRLSQNIYPLAKLRLKTILSTGEPLEDSLKKDIEEFFQAQVYDIYGLSAVLGPGIAYQCPQNRHLHLAEDVILAEIIDPNTLKPLPPGEYGELVLTTLVSEGFPLLRYRTGDKTRIIPKKCSCGRTFKIIEPIKERVDDVLIVKGINISPKRIASILDSILQTQVAWKMEVIRTEEKDELVLKIGITEELFYDQMKRQRGLVDNLRHSISLWLGVTPRVVLVEPESLKKE